LKAAYAVLSVQPYLARVELQDAETLAPNMRIQPSVRGRTWSFLSHEAIQPTVCTQCSVSCGGNRGSHPTVATYAAADHKFNEEPSSPLSLHHRWICPLWVKSRHVHKLNVGFGPKADIPVAKYFRMFAKGPSRRVDRRQDNTKHGAVGYDG
jgi:hypothetical protein